MRSSVFIILVLLTFAWGCGAHEDLSLSRAEKWLSQHDQDLLRLHDVILNQPLIRRVDPGMKLAVVEGSQQFDDKARAAYQEAEQLCTSLGIQNIAVARAGADPGGSLITIRYLLASEGIVTSSGGLLAVEFIPDEKYLSILQARGVTLKPLARPHWFIQSAQWK